MIGVRSIIEAQTGLAALKTVSFGLRWFVHSLSFKWLLGQVQPEWWCEGVDGRG